jgi:hypothetical protein
VNVSPYVPKSLEDWALLVPEPESKRSKVLRFHFPKTFRRLFVSRSVWRAEGLFSKGRLGFEPRRGWMSRMLFFPAHSRWPVKLFGAVPVLQFSRPGALLVIQRLE